LALIVARQTHDDDAAALFADAVARAGSAARVLADDNGRVPHIGDDDGGALTPIVERDPDDLRASLTIAGALADRPGLQSATRPKNALWLLGRPAAVHRPQSVRPAASAALPETGYYVSRIASRRSPAARWRAAWVSERRPCTCRRLVVGVHRPRTVF